MIQYFKISKAKWNDLINILRKKNTSIREKTELLQKKSLFIILELMPYTLTNKAIHRLTHS
jgi:hypothetical protein